MKFSRDWLSDFIDLTGLSDDEIGRRMTEIGHPIDAIEVHGEDTVFDAEITTNRIDAMSHLGMARELSAALGRALRPLAGELAGVPEGVASGGSVDVHIDEPELCGRYSGVVIRGIEVKRSPEVVRRRLEAAGLRPINNIVDVTNYVMLAVGHPLHAFDLDKLSGARIVVRGGRQGESLRSLDGELRKVDAETIVIADGQRAVALGGIIGGAESEITTSTRNVFLECAWFSPASIRRTARRLGVKTDASYRFERGVDPNDSTRVLDFAAGLMVRHAGGSREAIIDVVASPKQPKSILLRSSKLRDASAGVASDAYACALFQRLGFGATEVEDGLQIVVPTHRSDVSEEIDLIEEVLRFYGLDRIPAMLPRVTAGDAIANPAGEAEDAIRQIMVGSGLSEAIHYSFIQQENNALFTDERPILLTNALSENVGAMRLSLLPGLLETVAFNRSYGTRDGALFEIGRTYHRAGDGIREHRRLAFVMYGSVGSHWGDPKRPIDFFDAKGVIEQVAANLHVVLQFAAADQHWLKSGKRASARHGDRMIGAVGFLSTDVLQRFGIKGEVVAAQIDIEALLDCTKSWSMAPVSRFPGVPMILAFTHAPDLDYKRLLDTIHSLEVPYLHEVGLRDRFVAEGESNVVKTTLGMWYQAQDRSLTQEEIGGIHRQIASRVASLLPVTMIS